MHRKSDKNRTEPNELDELKYSKSLTQMTNYAHRYVLVFACSDMYQNIYAIKNQKKVLFSNSVMSFVLLTF